MIVCRCRKNNIRRGHGFTGALSKQIKSLREVVEHPKKLTIKKVRQKQNICVIAWASALFCDLVMPDGDKVLKI